MRWTYQEKVMPGIVKQPYLQWPTQHSITIMWETSEECTSAVKYCETRKVHSGLNGRFQTVGESQKQAGESALSIIHAITLQGLRADTTYHYKVTSTNARGETTESREYAFKTAIEEDTPFSFAVTSETAGDDQMSRRIFEQIQRYRPEFLLVVGDAVKNGSKYEDWERCLFGPGKDLFADTPFYLCPGNHEENAPWMYRFVAYPQPKNYYAFDYGNVHFVALDSTSFVEYREQGPVATKELEPGSPQYRFLVDDLKSAQATWKVVFFHYPPYVSGDYQVEQMRELCPVFEEYGVDLVFNSHTIVYERSHPIRNNEIDVDNGVIYIVVGGAGAKSEWFHHKRAWHTAQALAVPHCVQVVIAEHVLELHAIDQQGIVFDIMKLRKPHVHHGV